MHGDKVAVSLEGYHKGDAYGTNLELTGLGNWFGSMNMCNMMADNSSLLFGSEDQQKTYTEIGAVTSATSSVENQFCMLELGSGLGRAGLMAMKLMEREHGLVCQQYADEKTLPSWRCVLTDGEAEIVTLLENNFIRNIIQNSAGNNSNNVMGEDHVHTGEDMAKSSEAVHSRVTAGSSCQQLWWGQNAELADLQRRFPRGFDLIIGADLIYGRDVVPDASEDCEGAPVDNSSTAATDCQEAQTTSSSAAPTAPAAGPAAAVGGFCRDKLRSLLYTVCALLSKRGSALAATDSSGATTESGSPSSIFDVQRRPAFYLAVTRRELLPMEELSALALSVGLVVGMLDDYTFDIFDTNVDSESLFWRDTILSFTRV